MDWWQLTDDRQFADCIIRIAEKPQQGFGARLDTEALIELFLRLRNKEYGRPFVYEDKLLALIEKALTDTIRFSSSDSLSSIVDAVDAAQDLPSSVTDALQNAVMEEFEENSSRIRDEDSESSLSDRIDALKKFAPRFKISDALLASAIWEIEGRIEEIEDSSSVASSPSIVPSKPRERESFDDEALRNLFVPLLDR